MEPRGSCEQSCRAALAGRRALSAAVPSGLTRPARRLLFEPPRALRNAHLQSTLGSFSPLRELTRRRAAALLAGSRALLLDCGDGVRLQALHSAQPDARAPLALLLHGWEASAEATSVLSLGAALYARGYQVLRLNLRDHGDTHHLNREIFHSCRLPEVLGAIAAVAARFSAASLYLAGFSLGGNFLLRAAADSMLPARVAVVAAVCPVLDPAATLAALEQGAPLYRRHLVSRWSHSLLRKQRAWPKLHDFRALVRLADLRTMTAALVREHTSFASLEEYLQGYAITGTRLSVLRVPCHLLLADDDPLVPVVDAQRLADSARLTLWRSRYGGHCGFLRGWSRPTAADQFVLERFAAPEA